MKTLSNLSFFLALTSLLLLVGCSRTSDPRPAVATSTQVVEIVVVPTPSSIPPELGAATTVPSLEAPTSTPTTEAPTPALTLTSAPADPPPSPSGEQAAPSPQSSVVPPSPSEMDNQVCEDKAAFYADVTIPDFTLVKPGQAMVKTWRIRNTSDCVWEDYSLVYAGGELMGSPNKNLLPVIQPGEIFELSIDMVSPLNGGQYTSNWKLANSSGTMFSVGPGEGYLWVTINVSWVIPIEVAASVPVSNIGGCGVTRNQAYDNEILNLMNQARTANGLKPLVIQSQLSSAAAAHSTDMACNNFVGHTGSDGSNWYNRASSQGYANYNTARENIYVGNPAFGGDANGAFTWWMNSQIHRDNILYGTVYEVGIGSVYLTGSEYGGYYTVVFARP